MTSIGITGAGGTLGRLITTRLSDRGVTARLITRDPARVELPPGWEVRLGSYDDPTGLAEAFTGLDRVFLMSTPDVPEVRIPRHRTAVDATVRAGVPEVVFLSLRDAVPGSPFPFAAANHDAEQRLAASDRRWAVLAPNIYAEAIAAQAGASVAAADVLDMPFGDGRAGWVTRADIAAVAAAVLVDGFTQGAHLDITGPASVGADEIASILSDHLGRPIAYRPASDEAYLAGLLDAGLPPVTAEAFLGLCQAVAAGRFDVVTDVVADLTSHPPVPMAAALAATFPAPAT